MGEADDSGPSSKLAPPPGALSALLQALAAAPEPPLAEPVPLVRGTVVGRFEIVRELGRGAFGVVHEARDRELGQSVALKIVRPGRSTVGEAQLAREAEAVARLSHPNLVTLYEVGRSEHGPFLVFELLRGKTLQERLDEGPLEVLEAVHLGVEVARGLAHAHAEGVVHRDLKPSNVFVTNPGQVKILDFGMAHAFGRRRVSGGTPAYMAPEQWEENPEDERTDVFALGVMLHRMLSGEFPFPEDGGKWSSGAALAPRLEVAGVPDLGDLVGRMLEKVPAGRPRDGAEVLAALEPIEATLRSMPSAGAAAVRATRGRATLADLVAELKRRHVFRVMAGYGIFAFAVLQVTEPIMHGAHLPDWVLTVVLVALAVGFPAAIFLSWAFDLTPQGVRRTPSATGSTGRLRSRPRLAPVLAAAGVVAALPALGYLSLREGGWLWKPATSPGTSAVAVTNAASAMQATAKGPEFTILVAPFKASDASAEADAKLMDGLVLRALEKFVRHAPSVAIIAAASSPRTEAEAKALGKSAGARLVLWGSLTALREELVFEPVLTATRRWDVMVEDLPPVVALRWSRTDSSAIETRRQDAERTARPAAVATADKLSDSTAAFAILDDSGERSEFTEWKRAFILMRLGRHADAENALRAAIARWPGSFRLHRSLAAVLFIYLHKPADAEADAAAKLASTPRELVAVAEMYTMSRSEKRVLEVARSALRAYPANKEVGLGMAHIYVRWNRPKEARPLVEALAREPLSPEGALSAVYALTGLGEIEAAKPFMRRLVADDDSDPIYRANQARFYLSRSSTPGDRDLAVEGARRAARDAPDNPQVQQFTGETLLGAGLETEGLVALRRAVALAPESPSQLIPLGAALVTREPDAAREILKRATGLKLGPRNALELAPSLLMLREPAPALLALNSIPTPQADHSPVPEMRCDALVLAGQTKAALLIVERLRSTRPDGDWSRLGAFVCGTRAGDHTAAQDGFRTDLRTFQEPWAARIAAFLLGDLPEAELLKPDPGLSERDAAGHRCEANYYAGIMRLYPSTGASETVEATKRFRDSVESKGGCTEEDLASIELYRLEHPPK